MPGIDPNIALGVKVPDQTQALSSLLNVANGIQQNQLGAQKLTDNAITLGERQNMQRVLADPSNYTDEDGAFNLQKAQKSIMTAAPTTGAAFVTNLANMHQQATAASKALNDLTAENRSQIGSTLAASADAPPEVVMKTVDTLGGQFKGMQPLVDTFKRGYHQALQQGGPAAGKDFILRNARGVLPQNTQQAMDTPDGPLIDNGQQMELRNAKPGVRGYGQGAKVFSVQKQLPPSTPTIGDNNQPGYVGPQGAAPTSSASPNLPAPQPGVNGNFQGDPSQIMADIQAIKDPQERANAIAAFNEQARRTPGFGQGRGFVPSGPVPGANESKAATIAVNNNHWAKLNDQAENSQQLESVIQNIKALAPKAVTGTLAGRTAFVNGMLNSMHLGDKITGDLQKDTDLLEKNMAQLNLGTPAATDAVRTIVGAARPHGTMNEGAIQEASDQLLGQLRANRAVRNALTPAKNIQDLKGDPTAYTSMKQHMEELADPRIFQYESLPPGPARQAFINKQPDGAKLLEKTKALIQMGVIH